jgi:hypothetical protein
VPRLALGGKEQALHRPQALQCEVAFGGGHTQGASQRITLGNERGKILGGDGGSGRKQRHASLDRYACALFLQTTLE